MRVLVLGAGVVGVTIAWELARDGHEVTVVDRQPGVAQETSQANAGELSYGMSSPWAGPGVPLKALRWLAMHHRPLVLRPSALDPAMLRFLVRMLGECTAARYAVNKARMVRLADYSRLCLARLVEETGIAFDGRRRGTLQLLRRPPQLDKIGHDLDVLRRHGVRHAVLDRAGCVAREPALAAVQEKFVGGLHLPDDETGDCRLFTERLAARAEALGARLRLGVTITGWRTDGARVSAAVSDGGEAFEADAIVVAAATGSNALLAPLGLTLSVYPVKGYSLTLPIVDVGRAPESTLMDETHKVAITRLGDRIRVGGTAELAGFSLALHEARRRTLQHVVDDLFPGAGDGARASFWCGLRPMTPDGTPIVGATPRPGLWLATGHGTLGWTMAAGTARLIADLVGGRRPEIEHADLALGRGGGR